MSIEIKGISKRFKTNLALDDVSVTFEDNKIYGLLGRNGAGKTTLLNIITNRIYADSGAVLIDGVPAKENDHALKKVYMMSEKSYYPESMRIKEIFQWSKEFYPGFDLEYAHRLADLFELSLSKSVKALSTGYHSIFKVIVALSVNTPYVLLDEPVLGLDANHRDVLYRLLIEKYSQSPSTFIISTHLIEEVSSLIEDVVIIKKGKIIKNETREALMSCGYTVSGRAEAVDRFTQDKEVIGMDTIGGLKSAYVIGQVAKASVPEGLEITNMDLQKLFVQLTNV